MKHNRVHADFWDDTLTWNDDERLAAIYLLTCKSRNTEGLFRFRVDHAALDLRWTEERLQSALDTLAARGWAHLQGGWMLLSKSLRWEPPKGPKSVGGAVRVVESAPRDSTIWARFYAAAEAFAPDLAAKLDAPSMPLPAAADAPSGAGDGGSPSYSSPTPTPSRTPPPLAAVAVVTSEIRDALTNAGFDPLMIEQSDGAISQVLREFKPPADVDWYAVGQAIRRDRESGAMRTDRPSAAIEWVAKSMGGYPRVGSAPGGGKPSPAAAAKFSRFDEATVVDRGAA
jgi:hypothetical protein